MGVPEAEIDKIAHLALPLGKDHMLMGTDVLVDQTIADRDERWRDGK